MPTDPPRDVWVSLGAGGHAASVADALRDVAELAGVVGESSRHWSVEHFATDDDAIEAAQANGWKVLATVGSNRVRLALIDNLPGDVRFSVAARTATVALDAELGAGTVVLHHAHVGPQARLGRAVIINTGAIVEHDVVIDDGAHIGPGAAVLGAGRIGARVFIGSGARVLPGRTVGADAVVGAGAVVTEDVAPGVTVVGQPARPVRRPSAGEGS
jgi:sugar O-acyltransferase (sialic acid O-acetyltransferase NeuD family)